MPALQKQWAEWMDLMTGLETSLSIRTRSDLELEQKPQDIFLEKYREKGKSIQMLG